MSVKTLIILHIRIIKISMVKVIQVSKPKIFCIFLLYQIEISTRIIVIIAKYLVEQSLNRLEDLKIGIKF